MKRAVASLLLLVLSGCGTAAMPNATMGQRVEGASLESLSLQGDLMRKLGPIAARKAVQTAMKLALKKDAKAVDDWEQGAGEQRDADRAAFQQKRLKTLQRAVTAADAALLALEDVAAVKDALAQTKADDKAQAKAYQGPKQRVGKSNVGFAKSEDDVRTRIANIWGAHLEGHDISSHACGHFDGKGWSAGDWKQEFTNARVALRDAWKNVGLADKEPQGWEDFATHDVKGFRAPYLSTSDGLLPAEKEMGFQYDASLVTKGPALPQVVDGIYRFGLPLIPEGPEHRPVIGMDYNLYVRHSKGVEDKANAKTYEDRAFEAFEAAFDKQYDGERIPLQLGFHFVLMNDGAYWRAMERLVSEVCTKADVKCTTYGDYLNSLDKNTGSTIQNRS